MVLPEPSQALVSGTNNAERTIKALKASDREARLYCIKCGEVLIGKSVQGRTRQVCPRCGSVFYERLKVGAGALIQDSGELLLVLRSQDCDAFPATWSIPAGYCEADESPRDAAAREVLEETGIRIQAGKLVDVHYFDDDPRGNGLLIVYEGETLGDEVRNVELPRAASPEVAAAAFFPPDQVPEPLCGGGHDLAIRAWSDRSRDRWQAGAPFRYCPHCSHSLEKRFSFGRSRPVCRVCGYVYFKELKVGVSMLVEHHGRVLMVRRGIEPGLGQWGLPSGFLEWDETPEEGARRECEEETGLRVQDLDLFDVSAYSDDFRGSGINLTYRARLAGGTLEPGDDASAAVWVPPDRIPPAAEIAFQGHRVVIERWRLDSARGKG